MKRTLEELRALDRWLSRRLDGDEEAMPINDGMADRLLQHVRSETPALERAPLSDPDWIDGVSASLVEVGAIGPGARVGAFEIEHAIGAGGMGAVYLAHRVEGGFEQRVALKVLAGSRPGPENFRQFQRERDVLSRLDHPGIARLIDGGMTDDWRPWFAMEYVEGLPIDRYASDNRLGIGQRLDLFEQVCAALEYAHGQLVLHRDIKPPNLLVTDEGMVKVLDFGLARVQESLDPGQERSVTQTTSRWLTPEYASPEQVAGQAVTVTSEIYQLGLLLYRLLSGTMPFELTGFSPVELVRTICETEPRPPSAHWQDERAAASDARRGFPEPPAAVERRIRGDLDSIVLTAMARDPAERYAGVADLVEDIRRHREHRPVRARVGTRGYRLGKFVRRYRAAVAATTAVFALVLGALVVIGLQASQLAEERNRALDSADRNARLTEVLSGMVQIANVDAAGVEQITTVGERLEQYLGHVRSELADEPAARLQLLEVVGEAYEKLRDWPPAADVFDEAWQLSLGEYGPLDKRTLELQSRLAQALASIGDWERAEALLDELEQTYRDLHGERDPTVAEVIFARAYLYEMRLPAGDERTHDLAVQFRKALSIWEEHHEPPHEDLARALHYLGLTHPDRERGLVRMREGLEMSRAVLGEDHGMVARRKNDLALQLLSRGELHQSAAMMRRASDLHARAYGRTHPQTLSMRSNLAGVLQRAGENEEAIAVFEDTLELTRLAVDDDAIEMAYLANGLASALRDLGQVEDSEAWFREAVRVTAVNQSPLEGVARTNLASALILLERPDEARHELQTALQLNEKYFGPEHDRTVNVRVQLAEM